MTYDVEAEVRPLEAITADVDRLIQVNETLEKFLSRFNGERPPGTDAGTNAPAPITPPPCHRSELDRLSRTVAETSAIADLIARLG